MWHFILFMLVSWETRWRLISLIEIFFVSSNYESIKWGSTFNMLLLLQLLLPDVVLPSISIFLPYVCAKDALQDERKRIWIALTMSVSVIWCVRFAIENNNDRYPIDGLWRLCVISYLQWDRWYRTENTDLMCHYLSSRFKRRERVSAREKCK